MWEVFFVFIFPDNSSTICLCFLVSISLWLSICHFSLFSAYFFHSKILFCWFISLVLLANFVFHCPFCFSISRNMPFLFFRMLLLQNWIICLVCLKSIPSTANVKGDLVFFLSLSPSMCFLSCSISFRSVRFLHIALSIFRMLFFITCCFQHMYMHVCFSDLLLFLFCSIHFSTSIRVLFT